MKMAYRIIMKPSVISKINFGLCLRNIQTVVSKSEKDLYDIIIAGGGMVGTTMACRLGQDKRLAEKSILLLEGSPFKEWHNNSHYSNRVSALNENAKSLLDSIGAWEIIAKTRFKPVKKMQVWDALSDAMIIFSNDNMTPDIAYIVENDLLMHAVSNRVKEATKNVEVLYGAKIKDYKLPKESTTESTNFAELEMEDGQRLRCKLLIGADGAHSKVRDAMGTQYLSWDYNQMGIVATLKLSEPTENVVAWQRFLPTGPIALLPLTDELSSLVWTVGTEQAKTLLKLPIDSFVDSVNEGLWKQYSKDNLTSSASQMCNSVLQAINLSSDTMRQLPPSVIDVMNGSRAAFPLGFGHSARYTAPRAVLVGDAAHRVHPLAGQGVNLGFGDIKCLADIIGGAVQLGEEVGTSYDIHEYETQRQRHNIPTMVTIDTLQKLYTTNSTFVVMMRSVGLQVMHSLIPVKKALMKYAAA